MSFTGGVENNKASVAGLLAQTHQQSAAIPPALALTKAEIKTWKSATYAFAAVVNRRGIAPSPALSSTAHATTSLISIDSTTADTHVAVDVSSAGRLNVDEPVCTVHHATMRTPCNTIPMPSKVASTYVGVSWRERLFKFLESTSVADLILYFGFTREDLSAAHCTMSAFTTVSAALRGVNRRLLIR